jgi:tetratricopeptide (TPR) repeat protein
MEEERFCRACQLRDEGKLSEAYAEFARIAEAASDPLDKAGALIYGANTLEMSEQIEAAAAQLNVARSLMKEHSDRNLGRDEEFAALQLFLDYEDANICWLQSGGLETALNKFETTIKKHDLKNVRRKPNMTPKESHAYSFYQAIEIRRGFILADLGRWKEASEAGPVHIIDNTIT